MKKNELIEGTAKYITNRSENGNFLSASSIIPALEKLIKSCRELEISNTALHLIRHEIELEQRILNRKLPVTVNERLDHAEALAYNMGLNDAYYVVDRMFNQMKCTTLREFIEAGEENYKNYQEWKRNKISNMKNEQEDHDILVKSNSMKRENPITMQQYLKIKQKLQEMQDETGLKVEVSGFLIQGEVKEF